MSLYEFRIFKANRQLYVVQNAFANHPRVTQNALDWRHLIKIRNVFFSLAYANRLRQLNIYCRHMFFIKTGHEFNCCVFISREDIII